MERFLSKIKRIPVLYRPTRSIIWKFQRLFAQISDVIVLLVTPRQKRSFKSKVRYKMALDRNPLLQQLADKYEVRRFVADRIGTQYLTELIQVGAKPEDFDFDLLPREFVMKPNNASGALVMVHDQAPIENEIHPDPESPWRRFEVRPEAFDPDQARQLAALWLKNDYYTYRARRPEWAYRGIEQKVLFEELLRQSDGELPKDYRFLMFNGRCGLIYVGSDRRNQLKIHAFDIDWNPLPVGIIGFPNTGTPPPRPKELGEMLDIAAKLSASIDFIRVDLYLTKSGIRFGELTNYPSGGGTTFSPAIWNQLVGSEWQPKYLSLPSKFRYRAEP